MADRYLALKVEMMQWDANPDGSIFGGVILSYIDQAAYHGAAWEIRKKGVPIPPMVTVAMNKVEFHRPVFVGDLVSFYTDLVRMGRTSITTHVSVEVEREGLVVQVTEAEVVYVAIRLPERLPVPIVPGG